MTTKSAISEPDKSVKVESRAIYAALLGGAIGALVGMLIFQGGGVTLFERGISLGFVVAILGGVLALLTYLIVDRRRLARPTEKLSWWGYVTSRIDTWALALVHGLLAFLVYALLFYIVGQSFIGAKLDVWASSVLTALAAGFASYVVYLSVERMNAVRVSMLLAAFLVSGTFISMLTASNPQWWYYHFSSLGASGGVSAYAFNATLIIAGLVVVALSKYITDDFLKLQGDDTKKGSARHVIFQTLLSGLGIALACVGAFVYDAFPLIHNVSASGMAVLFLLIIVPLPWLMPQFHRAYFLASYLLLAALIASVWLFAGVGYFNLTVFELVAAAIIFTWLVVFVRNLAALLEDAKT
jgi:drug/metabolite transporter (DMT)-like permease